MNYLLASNELQREKSQLKMKEAALRGVYGVGETCASMAWEKLVTRTVIKT
jgi:hypothetical protein